MLSAAALLLAAAVWNGYPLTFWDTRAYVTHALTLVPRADRVIGYSLLIRALLPLGTLWAVVAFQALAVAFTLWVTARVVLGRVPALRFVAVVAALVVATALPWIAGQLMADIFTPILVLALVALVQGGPRVRTWERVALCALVALAAAVHITHALFGVVLLGAASLLATAVGRRCGFWSGTLQGACAIALGVAAMLGFNYARTGRLALVTGGDAFLLAHLVDSGIASRMLNEHCGTRDYLLCQYRDQLPLTPDEFLWQNELPFVPFAEPEATRRETRRLLHDSLREHPLLHLRVAAAYTIGTLGRFGTGEGLDSLALPGLDSAIAHAAPRDLPALHRSRQQHDRVPVAALRAVHTPVGWAVLVLGLAVIIVAATRGRRWFAERSVQLVVMALAAVVLYAGICGNTSGIYDRYESRLVWVVAFALWAAAEIVWRRRRVERREAVRYATRCRTAAPARQRGRWAGENA